ncbi:MAG: hypothetical protein SAK29_24705 [Scytonema sp. PMC 1069.18]|nr:hypothetical protein [Scytonema sp. PMC 1069.18]MEC4887974.1 hypothetical protein [Scytonema sp. PMC 1070.18]
MFESHLSLDEIKTACKYLPFQEKVTLIECLLVFDELCTSHLISSIGSLIDAATPEQLAVMLKAIADKIEKNN